MRRMLSIAFMLIIILAGIVFAVLNSTSVELKYYFGMVQVPLSLIIVLSIISGAMLGIVASMSQLLRAKRRIARLKKSVQLAEKEVTNLRTIPIKDSH